ARGIFAVTGDDNLNLVIALTAKQLQPEVKLVASCGELQNISKIKKAGADAVISPTYIGALRMASEMLRPTVVSFLDTMLRETDSNLRIEEIPIGCMAGQTVQSLNLSRFEHTLLLAIKKPQGWLYNPPANYVVQPEEKLICMTTPEDRIKIEKEFKL
ncbi:MAG: TrkA family potassium uptake protein, partial [Calditrichaeota bacterium]